MIAVCFLVSVCTLLADPTTTAPTDQKPIAYVGARVIPIAGPEIDNGVLVVRAGKILAVGPADQVQIPDGAERRDVTGKVIMPGLVDTHSHIGGPSGGDASGAIQPDCRACDAINVRDAGVQKAQAGGITTVNVMPGSGHLLSGQTIYLKLRDVPSPTIDDLAYRNADGSYAGGMKMANGTNSIRAAPFPGTRAKSPRSCANSTSRRRNIATRSSAPTAIRRRCRRGTWRWRGWSRCSRASASCTITRTATTTSSPFCACRRSSGSKLCFITSPTATKLPTRLPPRACRAASS
jgi:hypothetical protein